MIRALLLARYAPAAVLVNRDCQTLYFHGQTDDYLVHPAGEPTTTSWPWPARVCA
ncbi:MAG: hypothetical protein ACRDG9_13670 [Actinomycetota bacterium]